MKWVTDNNRTPDVNEWVNVAVRKSNGWITTTYGMYEEGIGWRLFDGFERCEWNPKKDEVLGWHSMLGIESLTELASEQQQSSLHPLFEDILSTFTDLNTKP